MDGVHLKYFFEIIPRRDKDIIKLLKEIHFEVSEVSLVEKLDVVTQDIGLNLSSNLHSSHSSPSILRSLYGGNLLTIELSIVFIAIIALNVSLEVNPFNVLDSA